MTPRHDRTPGHHTEGPEGQLTQASDASLTGRTAKARTSPIPRPGENVDPKPLPADQAELLAEVFDDTERVKGADAAVDSTTMQTATALETIYTGELWVAEWLEVKPPKSNATGQVPKPNTRNRFNEWMVWRATKAGRTPPTARRTYQLLAAKRIEACLNHGTNSELTERALRPLAWMLTRRYEDRIPEVEAIAREFADGGPLTEKVMRAAMLEWKRIHLGTRGVAKANYSAKARNYRPKAARAFDQLMLDDPAQAREFLHECVDKLKRRGGEA